MVIGEVPNTIDGFFVADVEVSINLSIVNYTFFDSNGGATSRYSFRRYACRSFFLTTAVEKVEGTPNNSLDSLPVKSEVFSPMGGVKGIKFVGLDFTEESCLVSGDIE